VHNFNVTRSGPHQSIRNFGNGEIDAIMRLRDYSLKTKEKTSQTK